MARNLLDPLLGIITLAVAGSALAAPPPGQSALLNGMHDIEAASWLESASPGCDKGWLTVLQYIGDSGTAHPDCHRGVTDSGISIIARLDLDGAQAIPKQSDRVAGFARTFADFVAKCDNIHVWIVGNEPNVTFQQSDPDCSTPRYVETYAAVHAAVHALPGHGADLMLVAPNSPYSPGCLHSLRSILAGLTARSVTPDGFALHAYTRADSAAALTAALASDTATQTDQTIDECPGNASWSDTWHRHLRIYRDYIDLIETTVGPAKPVFITETGNACQPAPGNDCYPDADIGYFQALYAEIDAYNQAPGNQTKIRAVTPYRWTGGDDGTGRDFEIGTRKLLLADLLQAFAKGYSWTEPACGGAGGCPAGDADCGEDQICRLTDLQCTATETCDVAGACAAGELCRRPNGDCVPAQRGPGRIELEPGAPAPDAAIHVTAVAEPGHTNVELEVDGPDGRCEAGPVTHEQRDGQHRWRWPVTLAGKGTYRATFRADPNQRTIYAVRYFNVPIDEPADTADAGVPAAGDQPDLAGDPPARPTKVDGACSLGNDGTATTPTFLLLLVLLILRRKPAR